MLSSASARPLTYCTNVHPAKDLAAMEAGLRTTVAPILHEKLGSGPQLLGAWWPRDVVDALGNDAALTRHVDLLRELELVPASLNIFPAGRFHEPGIKAAVYEPDWSTDARLSYSIAAARVCAQILCALEGGGERAVMSTVPLGFRGVDRDRRPGTDALENIFRCALALEEVLASSGVEIVLAIEPEPWCMLETIAETLEWFVDQALPFAASRGNEAAMRRHVGLCLDLCHAAVVGEDPVSALADCARAGMRIGKVQLSSAVVARGDAGREQLLAEFSDPVYLHQTWDRSGRVGPFLDLDGDDLRLAEIDDESELISHFHVPLHWSGEGVLTSTQDQVLRFLAATEDPEVLEESIPFEVETYTNPRIADELAFVAARMRG